MTFTVTYRDKDGALRDECVEAASRAECVAACRGRGITPTAIREGGVRGGGRRAAAATPNGRDKRGRSRSMLWGAAILAAAALVLGGVWWWLAARPANGPRHAEEASSPATTRAPAPHRERPTAANARPAGESRPSDRTSSPPG